MLPASKRLRKTTDFKMVYTRGRSYVHPMLVAYVLRKEQQGVRFGFSVSKKLGGAADRNRIKRLLREACRGFMSRLRAGTDVVIVGRSPITGASLAQIKSALDQVLTKAQDGADSARGERRFKGRIASDGE